METGSGIGVVGWGRLVRVRWCYGGTGRWGGMVKWGISFFMTKHDI